MSLEESSAVSATIYASDSQDVPQAAALDAANVAKVNAITEEIFGCLPTTETMIDPEEPEFSWLAFNVECRGEPKELVDRSIEWHRRVGELKLADHPRLSIMPIA